VYFHRVGGDGPASDIVPTGVVEDDGRFWVASGDEDGMATGMYHVLIEWLDRPTSSKGGAAVKPAGTQKRGRKTAPTPGKSWASRVRPPDRLKGRYLDIEHPLVTAEVKSGTNHLAPFELTD
jgi:hypothetical protein